MSVPMKAQLGKSVTMRQHNQDMRFYDEILATNDRVKSDRAVSDMINSSRIPVVRTVDGIQANTSQQCMFPPLKAYDAAATKKKTPEFDSKSAANSAYSGPGSGKGGSIASTSNRTKDSSTVYSDTLAKEQQQREQISKAFDWLQKARSRVDPATCYYQAAVLFNAQQMSDRAICYFLRALEVVSSLEIVDQLLLPDSTEHRRKLSRLSQGQLKNYIAERKRKRERYILEDQQRQYARLQSANLELFRLYMLDQFRDVGAAHRHLLESFKMCDRLIPEELMTESPDLEAVSSGIICDWRGHRDDEYHSSRYKYGPVKEEEGSGDRLNMNAKEKSSTKNNVSGPVQGGGKASVSVCSSNSSRVGAKGRGMAQGAGGREGGPRVVGDGWRVRNNALRFAHHILKTYVNPEKPESSIQQHILTASAGPLAEAHVVILRELLSLYPDNVEYAHHMGMRYAEKCDFAESHRYYQLAREIQDPTPADLHTVLEQRLSRSTNTERHLSSFMKYTSKTKLKEYTHDMEKDEDRLTKIKDFTNFLGKHEGTETVIVIPPESGWVSGVAEKQKVKERSQSMSTE